MVKIHLLAEGKIKEAFYRDAVAEYAKRLSRFADLTVRELPERNTLEAEGEDILRAARGYVVALAVEGKKFSSEKFAEKIKGLCDAGKEITLIIGSSCGLCEAVKRRADCLVSFSDMTFPHQLMRVILLEQLYRAFSINANAKYHK